MEKNIEYMKKYRLQKLINGSVVGHEGPVVAVPFSNIHAFMVTFGNQYMVIKGRTPPITIRTFEDLFGRDKQYKLWYYPWKPTVPKAVREVSVMQAIQQSGMTLDRLRSMRPKNL